LILLSLAKLLREKEQLTDADGIGYSFFLSRDEKTRYYPILLSKKNANFAVKLVADCSASSLSEICKSV
jgi:hypothetical protein